MSPTTIRAAATWPRPRHLFGLIAAALLLAPGPAQAQVASAQVEKALDGRGDGELRAFYARRGWRPLWLDHGELSPAAEALVELLADAGADGLPRKPFGVGDLASAVRKARRDRSPKALARADVLLSRRLAGYVQATRRTRDTGMSYTTPLLAPVAPTTVAALEAAAAAPSLERYVAGMQWMHPIYAGLRAALASGTLDPAQARVVRLNLERARGLRADPAPRYLLVDVVGARLWMYEDGKPVDSMKVVVGRPDLPTPAIAGLLTNAVLNPYWNVPVDLARSRIAANVLEKGLRYLTRDGYQVLADFSDKPKILNPARIDWKAVAAGDRELRVRQLPGKANFMGIVKFEFPNPDGIFLHDTPDKALLRKDVRTASSGCVRLEDAQRLGRWLFGKTLVARPRAVEQVVPLPQPVPVYIAYLTAAPEDGRIAFRDDVYGRDPAQLALIEGERR